MLILNSIKTLENSDLFKEWKKKHAKCYICSAFLILNEVNENPQIDYYDSNKDRITSFTVAKEIKITKNEKIFKEKEHKIKELDLDKVKISLEKALEMVENLLKNKYKETAHKKIIVLQNLDKQIWNITSLSNSLNVLNVRIDTTDGNIIEEKLSSILSFNAEKNKQNL